MRRLIITLSVVVAGILAYGQNTSATWTELEDLRQKGLAFEELAVFNSLGEIDAGMKQELSEGSLLAINHQALSSITEYRPEAISVNVPYINGTVLTLDLIRHEIVAPDFMVTLSSLDGDATYYQPGVYYKGVIRNDIGSTVAISFFNNEVIAVLTSNGNGNMVIGKLDKDANNRHVVYAEDDLHKSMSFECETIEEGGHNHSSSGAENSNPANCVRIYFECEYDMYVEKGSVTNTVNFMTGIYNVVSVLYANDGINTTISEIYVWNTPDSYATTASGAALYAFRNNNLTFNGDVAQLVSRGAPAGGGIAWIDQLCGSLPYSYVYIYPSYSQFPTYSWTVNVVAHELGHIMGSAHTHDCVWDVDGDGTPAEAIDGCGPYAGQASSGSCATAPLPTNGGTIMSYCHLVGGVGVNFNNGFGPLPKALIQDRVYNASCLSSCSNCNTVVTIAKTDISCYGNNNGSATASATSGSPPYNYLWSTGSTSATITGLSGGTYTVSVTDANGNGCTVSETVTINEPVDITLSTVVTPESMAGSNDGAIDLSVSGGTTPYSYAWSNSAATQDLTNLPAGTYNVQVTDQNGCTKQTTATVTTNCNMTVTISKSDANCYGSSNGSATAVPSGGITPYTYAWSTGSNSATITGLPAGTYTVTVTDASGNGCTASEPVTINEPADILLTTVVTHESMAGANDGAVDLSVSGGTTPYAYAWSNGAATQDLTNLPAGTYSVQVTDQNGCTKQTTASVITNCNIAVSISKTDVSCYGNNNGNATVTATGGTSPYTYLWSSGSTSAIHTGLSAGTYTVTVTDASGNGCSVSESVTITEPADISLTTVVTPESMAGSNDGAVDLSVSGGTPPYTYSWSNGVTTQDLTNLASGTYNVQVTDQNGCIKQATGTVTVMSNSCQYSTSAIPYGESFETGFGMWTQGQGDDLDWTRTSGTTPSKKTGPFQAYDGNYYAYIESNTGSGIAYLNSPCLDITGLNEVKVTFAYNMYGRTMGSLALQVSTNNGSSWTTIWNISGDLGSSWYTVSVSLDAFVSYFTRLRFVGNVSGSFSDMAIDDINILGTPPPCEVPVLVTASTDASCRGYDDGSAIVVATGGVPPYSYEWSNGSTSNSISGIYAGNYDITVTDSEGCEASETIFVDEPEGVVLAYSVTPATASNMADGAVDLSVSLGTPPYSYTWSTNDTTEDITNVPPGLYYITVEDGTTCEATDSVMVAALPPCNQTVYLDYVHGFEGTLGYWEQSTNDDFDWSFNTGSTPTKSTGPSGANEGNWYLYTESNGNSGVAELISPCISLLGSVSPQVTFSYSMYGNQMGSLTLDISTDNGITWTNLWNASGDQGQSWHQQSISLVSYQGYVRLRFRANLGGVRSDMAIDGVQVTDPANQQGAMPALVGNTWEFTNMYPNPAKQHVTLAINSDVERMLPVYIEDALGRHIYLGEAELMPGLNELEFSLGDRASGVYYLIVGDGDQQSTRLLVVTP